MNIERKYLHLGEYHYWPFLAGRCLDNPMIFSINGNKVYLNIHLYMIRPLDVNLLNWHVVHYIDCDQQIFWGIYFLAAPHWTLVSPRILDKELCKWKKCSLDIYLYLSYKILGMKNNNNRSGQSTKIVKEIVWPTFVLFINAKSEEKKRF